MHSAMLLLLLAGPAQTPKVQYWPRRDIGFPVPPAVLSDAPKPVKLRLYSAPPGGEFRLAVERNAGDLDKIADGKPPGFNYTAKGDGEEEFAVQLVYASGDVDTERNKLQAQKRIMFDTRPPDIQVTARGNATLDWAITDDNSDASSVSVQARRSGSDWKTMSRDFRLQDSYSWPDVNGEIEVRVRAKDKAGNESVSRIVRLSSSGGRDGLRTGAPDPTGDLRVPRRDDLPGTPQIVYRGTKDLTIKPKIMNVTRSGVRAVHLFVKPMDAPNAEWKLASKQDVAIAFEQADPQVSMPFMAPEDGRYGFIVIPESGAKLREPDPAKNATPQYLVQVDTQKPTVKVRDVQVTPGVNGPKVEILWDAIDPNMMPDPIVIEYAPTQDFANPKMIVAKIPNSRRYTWEVADKTIYKFFVRVRAVDQAGNSGEHVYEKEVNIDLDRPSATIADVVGSGSTTTEKPDVKAPLLLPDRK